jgi:outer membrane protein assembly factor BamD (BamD/ComL family)
VSAEPLPPAEPSSLPDASSLPRGRWEKGAGSSEPTIDEEVKLMTAAQAALRSGQPRRALHLLNEHARRFPNGKLASARAVAHMVALCAVGRADEARSEADRFLAKSPSSPFAERVRNVCAPSREGHD